MADELVDLQKIVITETISGAALDLGDGAKLIYLLRLGGKRMNTDEAVPNTIYAFDIDDLALMMSRMIRTASGCGDGKKLCEALAATMQIDPVAIEQIAKFTDEYMEQHGNG